MLVEGFFTEILCLDSFASHVVKKLDANTAKTAKKNGWNLPEKLRKGKPAILAV